MPITPRDFNYIRDLVLKGSSIALQSGKEYLVDTRLKPLIDKENFDDIGALVSELQRSPFSPLHVRVIEAMTTNETSFFRDIRPFEAIRQHILPEIIERNATTRTLRLWSAASSSGQEPYSLAISIREHFPQLAGWRIEILATDLSSDILQTAREGVYSQFEVNRGLPASLLTKYFDKIGIKWQIKEHIRNLVNFRQMNLAKPWSSIPTMDVILVRNVLIYFDADVKTKILDATRKVLKVGGYLFLGGAETISHLDKGFGQVALGNAVCYQNKG